MLNFDISKIRLPVTALKDEADISLDTRLRGYLREL